MIGLSVFLHGLMTSIFIDNFIIFSLLFIRGAFPDIVGIIGGSYKDDWFLYQKYHLTDAKTNYNKWYWKTYKILVWDHLLIDKYTHKNGKWTLSAYFIEGTLWILILIFLLTKFGVL